MPDDVLEQDGLQLYPGQMVNIKLQRDDGWTYGTVHDFCDYYYLCSA